MLSVTFLLKIGHEHRTPINRPAAKERLIIGGIRMTSCNQNNVDRATVLGLPVHGHITATTWPAVQGREHVFHPR
jgi:hypothetical protein